MPKPWIVPPARMAASPFHSSWRSRRCVVKGVMDRTSAREAVFETAMPKAGDGIHRKANFPARCARAYMRAERAGSR